MGENRGLFDAAPNSPRRNLVYQAAASTLKDQAISPLRWQHFKQPLPLLLQTFQELTEKNEDFWFKACSYFKRLEFPQGAVVFNRGVRSMWHFDIDDILTSLDPLGAT